MAIAFWSSDSFAILSVPIWKLRLFVVCGRAFNRPTILSTVSGHQSNPIALKSASGSFNPSDIMVVSYLQTSNIPARYIPLLIFKFEMFSDVS